MSSSLFGAKKYFFESKRIEKNSIKKIYYTLCKFLMRTLQYFQKKFKKFPTYRVEKTTSKILNFIHPELPKWPKQKNSCSKKWLLEQLYIKLGLKPLTYSIVLLKYNVIWICVSAFNLQYFDFSSSYIIELEAIFIKLIT